MKTVWKHQLVFTDLQSFDVPKGAKPLCIKSQKGIYTLWFLCDPDEKEVETMTIRVAGTGHPIEEEVISYIGTIIEFDGDLVWHFFWVK